jgi:hypothetical protein
MAFHDDPELYELFYSARFQRVIDVVASRGEAASFEAIGIEASALFEMHRAGEAKARMASVIAREDARRGRPSDTAVPATVTDAHLSYLRGRFSYLDCDYRTAERLFSAVAEAGAGTVLRFKALLGLANLHYTEGRHEAFTLLMREIVPLAEGLGDDDRICVRLVRGKEALASGADPDSARSWCTEALTIAAQRGWLYWIIDGLYLLASIEHQKGDEAALTAVIGLLRPMLAGTQALLRTHLVNERFKDSGLTVGVPYELDAVRHRLRVRDRWIDLGDKPLLFTFVQTLDACDGFVDKADLAARLWPGERYVPSIHDGRIFNLASRVRNLIEAYENQPVILLSGRLGYRLARRSTQ